MQTVRRLYVYLLSGITLGILVYGLITLLEVLLAQLGIQGALVDRGGSDFDRQQLSLAAALIGVGLPVWGIHWWLAERGLAPGRPGAEEERGSTLRALYLTVVLAVLLGFGAWAAQDLVRQLVRGLMPPAPDDYLYYSADPARSLATLMVTAAAWAYHVVVRRRDLARGPLHGAAAWLPRVYLYGATLVALSVTLQSVGDLLSYAGDALLPLADNPEPLYYRWDGIAGAASLALVWGIGWLGHWWYAGRLVAADGWRAAGERAARLRVAFFVGVILTATFNVIRLLAGAGTVLLGTLIGADPETGGIGPASGSEVLRLVPIALASAVPWGIAWWVHQRRMHDEALQADDLEREASAVRLDLHAVAAVGLAFGAVGLAWLIGLAIDSLFGASRALGGTGFWRYQLASNLPYATLGLIVWAWRWWPIQARHAANPATEAASTVRRAYLLLVLGTAVISSLGSLAVVLYRLFGTLLGAGLSGDAVSELATPIGVLLTAAAVALYHGLALRRDLALRAEAEAAAAAVQEEEPGVPAASRRLVLSGPTGAEVEAALAVLRDALPPGVTLDEG